jgi:hypothetical protein
LRFGGIAGTLTTGVVYVCISRLLQAIAIRRGVIEDAVLWSVEWKVREEQWRAFESKELRQKFD